MKRRLLSVVLVMAVVCWGATAWADFINLPIKWSQPLAQGTSNLYWQSTHNMGPIVTNDWLCDDPRPIVAARWWGTYGTLDANPVVNHRWFELMFHNDVPAGVPDDPYPPYAYSHPKQAPPSLQSNWVYAQEVWVGNFNTPGGLKSVYRYDAYLTTIDQYGNLEPLPFNQLPGTIYWLDIAYDKANVPPKTMPNPAVNWFRWQAASDLIDFSITMAPHTAPWTPLEHDASFDLMVIPVPATLPLVSSGLLGLAALAYRRRQRK